MKKMKRILSLVLVLVMAAGLAAWGSKYKVDSMMFPPLFFLSF